MKQAILEEVKRKLKKGGFDGLYVPGECACMLDDLAPCGECQREDGEVFINGCEPGYLFHDPRPGAPAGWMIRGTNQEPTLEDWARLDLSV